MSLQDVVLLLELAILVKICCDDHSMKQMAKESLTISRESLDAQKQYLDLRRRWYESRTRKKNENEANRSSASDNPNSV